MKKVAEYVKERINSKEYIPLEKWKSTGDYTQSQAKLFLLQLHGYAIAMCQRDHG